MIRDLKDFSLEMVKPSHQDALYQAFDENKDYLSTYLDFVKDLNYEELGQAIRAYEGKTIMGQGSLFGLFKDGACLGMVSLSLDAYNSKAELGYWLGQAYTGRGYMTRAIEEVMRICFDLYRVYKVYVKIAHTNTRSIRLAERLGFSYEARLRDHQRINGEYYDLLVYSMLKKEWDQVENNR